jgi:hypothetical protein
MNPHKKVPEADKLLQLLESGLTRPQIAARYACNLRSVTDAVRRHGFTQFLPSALPPQDNLARDAIATDLRNGLLVAQIGRKHGVTSGTVRRFIEANGLVVTVNGIRILPDKTIVAKRYTMGPESSTSHMSVSLPRNSLHIAALQEGR